VNKEVDILGMHHLGLTVSDLNTTSDFFIRCLGWSIVKELPDYPAVFVSNGKIMITLWQAETVVTEFDYKRNVGLHHFALKVASAEELDSLFAKIADYSGVKIEFRPELLGGGPTKHCMFYEPGGIRMEFIWSPAK